MATLPKDRARGIDTSRHQGDIDWKKVKASGIKFAFIKATEGKSWVDPKFPTYWSGIYKAGILIRGAYHYAHIEGDPRLEAAHFVATVKSAGKITSGDFLILDAEDVCKDSHKYGPARTAAWINLWLDAVTNLSGLPAKRVLVYTGKWWWGPRTGDSNAPAVSGHPLWLSAYVEENRMMRDKLYDPWPNWRIWQFSSSGTCPGVDGNVDLNVFNGTYRGLWYLSGRPLRLFGKRA